MLKLGGGGGRPPAPLWSPPPPPPPCTAVRAIDETTELDTVTVCVQGQVHTTPLRNYFM